MITHSLRACIIKRHCPTRCMHRGLISLSSHAHLVEEGMHLPVTGSTAATL